MTDLTPAVNDLLRARGSSLLSGETSSPSGAQVDEFLKEAHRIVRGHPTRPMPDIAH